MKRILYVLVFVISVIFANHSHSLLLEYHKQSKEIEHSPLYLPQVQHIKFITLGYNNFASDILWFQTLNYFGKQLLSGRDYKWLGHMCELVTELDPKTLHTYEFCATLLAWVANDSKFSTALLTKGINANPKYWRLYYLRGFNQWYFHENFEEAQKDFRLASNIPDAPDFVGTIASRLLIKTDSPESAIQFLKEMEERSNNESVKRAFASKRKEAIIAMHINFLKEAIKRYEHNYNKPLKQLDDLVLEKIITKIPDEPFNGYYKLDNSGNPISSTGHMELKFNGNTARNSILKK